MRLCERPKNVSPRPMHKISAIHNNLQRAIARNSGKWCRQGYYSTKLPLSVDPVTIKAYSDASPSVS